METFECPAEGDKCDRCVVLARRILEVTLENAAIPHSTVLTEQAKVEARVNESPRGALDLISCDARQMRAGGIGLEMGLAIIKNKHDS